jgi:hypothetical protein
MPWANLAFWLRCRRTIRLAALSWTMTAATSRGELVADLVVALGGAFLAEVVVLPARQVGELGHGAEGCPA